MPGSPIGGWSAGSLTGVALGALAVAGAVSAAAQNATPVVSLETIEVQGNAEKANGPVDGYVARRNATATKTDTPLIETPQSVTVITGDQMADQGAQSVGQALRYSAGVLAETHLSAGRYDSTFVRGFGGSGGAAGFVNNLDGLRYLRGQNYLVPAYEPWGLERIEVLRGPSSVVFGQVKPGGVVNMISKRPKDQAHGEVEFLYGSFERAQMAFDFGGPVDAAKTRLYRVVGLGRIAGTPGRPYPRTPLHRAVADLQAECRDELHPAHLVPARPRDRFLRLHSGCRHGIASSRAGRIHSQFFPGEPGFEGYSRNQTNIGYAFEHRFDDVFTFRQNLRVSDLIALPDRLGRRHRRRPEDADPPRHGL